jgi:integrase/recombinase XerD
MSTAPRLVRDSDGGDQLPPLVAWELFMPGAGRSERTIHDGVLTLQELSGRGTRS